MPIAIYILIATLLAIAFRKVINLAIPIWAIMTIGALAALLLRQITPMQATSAIDPEVMFYLFGIFFIAQAAELCGYLEQLTDRLFNYTDTGKRALLITIFVLGLSSALLMNDTIAIIGTPILIQLCKSNKQLLKPLLLSLAFAITTGSVLSPIGNPQNLLIAVKGNMTSPFSDFIMGLGIPTLINLVITFLLIFLVYRKALNQTITKPTPVKIKDTRTAGLVKISFALMLILIFAKIINDSLHTFLHINFSWIALIAALPIILFSTTRLTILKKLDWGTLLFFANTFILMQSVWDSGFFQNAIEKSHLIINHIPVILTVSVILSQFISNVPLVTLYLPLLTHYAAPQSHLLTLAAGSTIAGNLSILGAASNIIILQNSEKRGEAAFGFFDFIKIGVPLTLINIFVYAIFLR